MRKLAEIASYHAHIYYEIESRATAETFRDDIEARFSLRLGRWHDQPIGPHGSPMYQVAFNIDLFATLVPWMMLNNRGLSILVHPNTTSPRRDHIDDSLWIGKMLPVRADYLPIEQELPDEAGEPNTSPDIALI